MNSDDLKTILLELFPDARVVSGGKNIVIRCRFCGDSRDLKKKHLYISLGTDSKPPMYNCFKCNESGLLTSRTLHKLNVNSPFLGIELDKNAILIKSNPRNKIKINNNISIYNIYNCFPTNEKLYNYKINYINARLGLDLPLQELVKQKIILNLHDLLYFNKIDILTRDRRVVDELNDSFLGFLSIDNSFISMRNLREGSTYQKTRYVNYSIFNDIDNSKRFYTIPTQIDLLKPIDIHLAEGAFDILSIFYNLRDMNTVNNIYSAVGNKAFLNALKLFVLEYGLISITLHLYLDNDMDDWELKNIFIFTDKFGIPVVLHTNAFKNEKDFGVPKDRIAEKIIWTKN